MASPPKREERVLSPSVAELDKWTFTSTEVSRIAQVSLRQLQWLDERHLVSPRKEGHRRTYLAQEALEIMILAALRQKGMSLQKIRRMLPLLQRKLGQHPKTVASATSSLYLVTDGKSIYLDDRQDRLLDRLSDARQPMWVVCLGDHIKRLKSEAQRRPRLTDQIPLF